MTTDPPTLASLHDAVRARLVREIFALGACTLAFATVAWIGHSEDLRGSAGLAALTTLGVLTYAAFVGRIAAGAGLRDALSAQAKLLRDAWAWYALPLTLASGLVAVVLAKEALPPGLPFAVPMTVIGLMCLGMFLLVAQVNRVGARTLSAQAEALPPS